jgi:twin BRCT domain
MLASDLGIGSHLRGILEGLIVAAGGKLATQPQKTDMYICKHRDGEDYKLAARSGKEVGNLAWLYYMITNNAWTSPMRRLLHYPIAREGLPGFKDLRISLSNYSGEARVYLENLIVAAGAECTKTLKQDNTHLITAHVMSEKCAAAKDWGIHLINHLWLEESYAKWKMQSVTDSRYTHFPSRTNLGEVVGQTKIDRDALERNFFSMDEDVDMEDAEDPAASVLQKKPNKAPSLVPQSSMIDSPKGEGANRKSVRYSKSNGVTPKAGKDVRKLGEPAKYRTPRPSRFIPADKENETPSTASSRKSKDIAVANLHNIASDIALYEKERKRVGGVVYGGRRKNDEDRIVHHRKRSIDQASDEDSSDGNEQKRLRKGFPPPVMHLLISGYKKWVDHPKVEDNDKVCLLALSLSECYANNVGRSISGTLASLLLKNHLEQLTLLRQRFSERTNLSPLLRSHPLLSPPVLSMPV